MSKKDDIEKKTEALLTPIAEANGVRVYDVEYVKEAGEWYLRAYIDKDGGVDINECVDVSHALSDALDVDDFIEEAYTLEVSSPGLGRQLKKDRHFANSIGQDVELKLFKPRDGVKEFAGTLSFIIPQFREAALDPIDRRIIGVLRKGFGRQLRLD